jgi:hypothetical protein
LHACNNSTQEAEAGESLSQKKEKNQTVFEKWICITSLKQINSKSLKNI